MEAARRNCVVDDGVRDEDRRHHGRVPARPRFVSDPRLRALATRQESILSRNQLAEIGATRARIAVRVRAGTWTAIGPNVVALHGGPVSPTQLLWVAVLHGGPDAALSRMTAATVEGLTGFADEPITVVVPHGQFHDDLVDGGLLVRVTESRRLPPVDLHPTRLPRRTRLPRSIV